MKPCPKFVCTLLLPAILLVASLPLAAQDDAPDGAGDFTSVPDQVISTEAREVLARMTAGLQKLDTFSVRTRSTRDEVVEFGFKLQNNEVSTVLVQRPNRLRAEVSGDLRNRTLVYDGSLLFMHSPDDDAYVRVAAPDNIRALMEGLLELGVDMPLVDFLLGAGDGALTEYVRAGIHLGTATIDGIECDQLAFRQANIDWQLWVEKGPRALPRKIVITTRYEFGEPQFQAILDWNLAPKIDASTFRFVAPAGSVEIPLAAVVAAELASPGQE